MSNLNLTFSKKLNDTNHYLEKYGFQVLDKQEFRSWTGSSNVYKYQTDLALNEELANWKITIEHQSLLFNQGDFVEIHGTIELKEAYIEMFLLKNKDGLFTIFRSKKNIDNFFRFSQNACYLKENYNVKSFLLENYDRTINITIKGHELIFKFFFNNHFENDHFDGIYNLLKEIVYAKKPKSTNRIV